MTDVIIIGSGPGRRFGFALCDTCRSVGGSAFPWLLGALEKAALIENYYGFAEPVSGAELRQPG